MKISKLVHARAQCSMWGGFELTCARETANVQNTPSMQDWEGSSAPCAALLHLSGFFGILRCFAEPRLHRNCAYFSEPRYRKTKTRAWRTVPHHHFSANLPSLPPHSIPPKNQENHEIESIKREKKKKNPFQCFLRSAAKQKEVKKKVDDDKEAAYVQRALTEVSE